MSLKPQLVQDLQYVISLLFHSLSMGNISKITTKFSGLSLWITSVPLGGSIFVEWIASFVKRITVWSLQEARTEAVRLGCKSSLNILTKMKEIA